jgi:hypothetical protein
LPRVKKERYIRYFRKFDPQFGTEFEDILVSCLVLQVSENSDIHCTTHAEFPPPRAARRDYYLSPRTILERAEYDIISPHFVLVFKSSNTPQIYPTESLCASVGSAEDRDVR